MEIGRLGVWTWLDSMSAAEAADFAGQLEAWGYSALWVPEAVGRDPFSFLGYLAVLDKEARVGDDATFTAEDRRFLESVASLAGIALDSARQVAGAVGAHLRRRENR